MLPPECVHEQCQAQVASLSFSKLPRARVKGSIYPAMSACLPSWGWRPLLITLAFLSSWMVQASTAPTDPGAEDSSHSHTMAWAHDTALCPPGWLNRRLCTPWSLTARPSLVPAQPGLLGHESSRVHSWPSKHPFLPSCSSRIRGRVQFWGQSGHLS